MSLISPSVRRQVRRRARGRCEYCHTCEEYTGHEFTLDHVVPESLGGSSDLENLCWCCFWCNNYKQARTHVLAPRTGHKTPLFNPRKDAWIDHLRWNSDFSRIVAGTAVGRATIRALRLNRVSLVRARRIWSR